MGKIEDFLKLYHSKNTVMSYRYALSQFFEAIYGKNEHKLEEYADRYFSEKRDVEANIETFFTWLNGRPPKTVRLFLAAVKSFFIENDVELPQKFWRRLIGRVKGNRALTMDRVPSNVELRRILLHTSIQGKALFLTLSSSGMRIGEALKLKLEDFDFEKQPCQVNIRGEYTKTGNPRITFISSEAVMAIQEWLKVRSKYLLAASRRSHKYGKSATDDRIFPFENVTAYEIWKHALEKAQFLKHDSSTNRLTLHPHVLRKFFRTRLGTVIPVDVTEALMGHEEYLTEVYRKYNPEDLAKFYLQGEAALLIFTEAEEVSKLRVEVEDKSKQLDAVIRSLVTENADLKRRIQNTEKKLDDLEKLVKEAKQLI